MREREIDRVRASGARGVGAGEAMQTLSFSKSLFMGILTLEQTAFFCYLLQPKGTPRDNMQKRDRQLGGVLGGGFKANKLCQYSD